MAKGLRRNPKPRAAAFHIKALTSYHGNLCAHLQDAEVSQKVEEALENLKIDEKIVESFKVGDAVLVAITTSGKRKFRRVTIDMLSENLLDATDLDTNEYYADVDRRSVYSIKHLKNQELIDAAQAESYYVHGYHNDENVVSPKQLEKLFRHLKGMRWLMQKTGMNHAIDEETPVIKLSTENNKPLETVMKIKSQPRQETAMPMLFAGKTEEVRVFHSEQTMGVQLRYLPQQELRRLEVSMTEAFEPDFWKPCDSATTTEEDLVAALYNGRRVRGYVVEVRPGGARVYLYDYGLIDKFRYQRLWHLPRDFAFKLPRYGLRVQLPTEPDDFFDDCSIEISLGPKKDDFTFEGEILRIVDETVEEPLVDAQAEATGTEKREDEVDDAESAPSVDGADPGSGSALRPESLSPALANYLGSTSENFIVNNEDRSPPSAPHTIDEASASAGPSNRLSVHAPSEPAPRETEDQRVEDMDPIRVAAEESEQPQEVPQRNNGRIAVDSDENSPDEQSTAAAEVVRGNDNSGATLSTHKEPEASGDRNHEEVSGGKSSSHASPKDSGDSGASSLEIGDGDLVNKTTAIKDGRGESDNVPQPESPPEVATRADDSECTSSEIDAPVKELPKDSQTLGGEDFNVPEQPESAPVVPARVVEVASSLSVDSADVEGPKNEECNPEGDLGSGDQAESGAKIPKEVLDSTGPASDEHIEIGKNCTAERECEPEPEATIQPVVDVQEVPRRFEESTFPLPGGLDDGNASTRLDTSGDERKVEDNQDTKIGPSEANRPRDISDGEQKSDVSFAQSLKDTEKPRSANDHARKTSKQVLSSESPSETPIERAIVEVEQAPIEIPNIAQTPARVEKSRQEDEARVPDLAENIEKVRNAESPIREAVRQKTPKKPQRSTAAMLRDFEREAQFHNLTLPFSSSDPVLIVNVGKSRRESTESKKPENRRKTDGVKAGKPARTANAPEQTVKPTADDATVPDCDPRRDISPQKTVDDAKVPQVLAKPDSRLDVPDSADARMKALITALHEDADHVPVPDGYVEGQFDDADDSAPPEIDQDKKVVPEKNRVEPVSGAEKVPGEGSVGQTAGKGNEHPLNSDAVVPQEEELEDEVSQEKKDGTASRTDVSELSTCDSPRADLNKAEKLARGDSREVTQTDPQVVVPDINEISDESPEEIADQAAAETTVDELPPTSGSSLGPSQDQHLEVDGAPKDIPESSQDGAKSFSISQASEVPDKVREEDSIQNAVAEAPVTPAPNNDSCSKQGGEECFERGDARIQAPENSPQGTATEVEETPGDVRKKSVDTAVAGPSTPNNDSCSKHGEEECSEEGNARKEPPENSAPGTATEVERTPRDVRKKSVDTAIAGPSTSRRPSNGKSATKYDTKKSRTVRVRDFCEYPKLTFDTGKVLLATITWIVNSRQLLMTHGACLASIEDQLGTVLGDPDVEKSVRAGKTVLVDHNGAFRRACIAGIQKHAADCLYYVYLLDYPECLSTVKLYVCPPAVAAMPRALLFVQLIGSQITSSHRIGDECKLFIDRFDGSVICGLVVPDPECSAAK